MTVAERRKSKRDALLDLLSDGRQHHMSELIRVGGYRYGARIKDLRDEGMVIETIRLRADEFAYKLIPHGQQRMI